MELTDGMMAGRLVILSCCLIAYLLIWTLLLPPNVIDRGSGLRFKQCSLRHMGSVNLSGAFYKLSSDKMIEERADVHVNTRQTLGRHDRQINGINRRTNVHLRTFAPIATAHPYSARKFTCHVMHRARALSTKMNNDRADGHCYSFAWI